MLLYVSYLGLNVANHAITSAPTEHKLPKENENSSVNNEHDLSVLPLRLKNSAIHRKYNLQKEINTDFAGTLYSTAKRVGGKDISVKVLKEGYALLSNTLGNIEHSRICQILHTIIERETIQAVVLEKPEGTPLSEMVLKNGALPAGQVVSAGLQLLSALHAVHWTDASVGNLHSDSIFLSRDRQGNLELQLTNLGIGCVHDKLRETDYLAPEQIMGGKSTGQAADIWAVGAILYEMLTGRRAFKGENRYAVAGEILLQDPDFSLVPESVPDDLVAIIRRALDKDESKRFSNVAEMVSELLPFQSEFNEPMSPAAQTAIRKSYPPDSDDMEKRTSSAAKTATKTSEPVPKAKVIPTVRISHTPSYPPSEMGKKTGNLLRDDPHRVGKQTKMGMPAIALPAKRIPLKSSDDTASFGHQSRSPNGAIRRDAQKNGEIVQSSSVIKGALGQGTAGRALSVITKTVAGIRATISITITKTIPKLMANPPKVAEIKSRIMTLPLKTKVGVVLVLCLLVSLPIVFSNGSDKREETLSEVTAESLSKSAKAAYMEATAEYHGRLAEQKPLEIPDIEFPKVPKGKKVTIDFSRKIPNRWRVKLNGNTQKRLPIVMDATDVPVSISISARGYETFSQVVVPLKDITIKVEMTREIKNNRKSWPGKASQKDKKIKKNLASNPFG